MSTTMIIDAGTAARRVYRRQHRIRQAIATAQIAGEVLFVGAVGYGILLALYVFAPGGGW